MSISFRYFNLMQNNIHRCFTYHSQYVGKLLYYANSIISLRAGKLNNTYNIATDNIIARSFRRCSSKMNSAERDRVQVH